MNKHAIWISLLLTLVLSVSGCSKPISSPQGASRTSLNNADKEDFSAAYFYLASRIHAQNNEIPQAIASLEKAIEQDPDSAFLKRDLIRFYIEQKKEDQALVLAQALVDKDPENADNLLLLVRLIKKADTKSQLPGLLKKILTLDPSNKETYLRLGKVYMENQDLPKALDLFSKMAEQFPDYYVAYFYLGEAHLMLDHTEPAKEAFLKTIELEPELVEPRFRLIEIYEKQEKNSAKGKILDAYEKILEIEPENDRAILEMALFKYKNDQTDEASQLFLELGTETKQNAQIIMTAVDTFITGKRYEDAVIVFSQMLAADPEDANLNFFTGMAYEAVGNLEMAITHYLKVTPEHPQYKKTLLSIAFLYRDLNKTDLAIQLLEHHHKKNPKDIDIISYLASFYEDQTRYDKAMAILEKGIKDAPDNTILLFRLGAIQDKAGLKDLSIQTMKSVIQIDPENASALNYLGYTYADMGTNLDEALDLISRALKQKPDDSYITDSMGWVYFQRKDYEKAVHYLEQAAKSSDFEAIIAGHLADAYVKTGQLSKALIVYKKALSTAKKEELDLIQNLKEKIKHLEKKLHAK